MANATREFLPAPLDATSEHPPPLFDGTTRLYTNYICPYAQRVWITRNYKGLQDQIKLVPLNLPDRPAWYKEKVYPPNKVPSLEHNGKIIGESLDLIKYVDSNFEGPSLFPKDPEKKKSSVKSCYRIQIHLVKHRPCKTCPVFDYLENALHKFDGPFFLGGEFSLVDVAFIPLVERFKVFLLEVFNYDVTADRPKLTAWIEDLNKIDVYTETKTDPHIFVEFYKKRFLAQE